MFWLGRDARRGVWPSSLTVAQRVHRVSPLWCRGDAARISVRVPVRVGVGYVHIACKNVHSNNATYHGTRIQMAARERAVDRCRIKRRWFGSTRLRVSCTTTRHVQPPARIAPRSLGRTLEPAGVMPCTMRDVEGGELQIGQAGLDARDLLLRREQGITGWRIDAMCSCMEVLSKSPRARGVARMRR